MPARLRAWLSLAGLACLACLLAIPALAAGQEPPGTGIPVERLMAHMDAQFALREEAGCGAERCLYGPDRRYADVTLEIAANAQGEVLAARLMFPFPPVPPERPGSSAPAGEVEKQIALTAMSLRFVANASGEEIGEGLDIAKLDADSAVLRYLYFRQVARAPPPLIDRVPVSAQAALAYRLVGPVRQLAIEVLPRGPEAR